MPNKSQMINELQKVSTHKETGYKHVETINKEPSKTQQQWKDDCDINNIMKKYSTTGEFTHLTQKQGAYGDFSTITDYQDMLETVKYADEAFSSLPADVRLRFNNNPGDLLTFIQNKNNYDEGVKLGLLNKKQTQTQTPQKINEQTQTNNENYEEITTTTITKKAPIKKTTTTTN